MDKKIKKIIKFFSVFLMYLFNGYIVNKALIFIGINDNIISMFTTDIMFLIFMLILYKKELKSDIRDFKRNYSVKEKTSLITKNVLTIFLILFIYGFIVGILFPQVELSIDDNSKLLKEIFNISSIYTIFKILIFAPIAEEIMFRKTVRDGLNTNKYFYIFVSSLIYAVINIAYHNPSEYIFIDALSYFIISLYISNIYIKNNENIYTIILTKFIYNLIPLAIMLIGQI